MFFTYDNSRGFSGADCGASFAAFMTSLLLVFAGIAAAVSVSVFSLSAGILALAGLIILLVGLLLHVSLIIGLAPPVFRKLR